MKNQNRRFHIQLDRWPVIPWTTREASGVPLLHTRRGLTLLSQLCRDPAIRVRNGEEPWRYCLNPRLGPLQLHQSLWCPEKPLSTPQYPWLLRGTPLSSLRSWAQVEGTQGGKVDWKGGIEHVLSIFVLSGQVDRGALCLYNYRLLKCFFFFFPIIKD